jgi:hypothetical protein
VEATAHGKPSAPARAAAPGTRGHTRPRRVAIDGSIGAVVGDTTAL